MLLPTTLRSKRLSRKLLHRAIPIGFIVSAKQHAREKIHGCDVHSAPCTKHTERTEQVEIHEIRRLDGGHFLGEH